MRVNITKQHIRAGGHGASNCPIFLALKEVLTANDIEVAYHTDLGVTHGYAHFYDEHGMEIYIDFPPSVTKWIEQYDLIEDNKEMIDPLWFEVDTKTWEITNASIS